MSFTPFTISQIKEAHAKVKSGADFPNYIRAIKSFGVKGYTTFVGDRHTDYAGDNGFLISSPGQQEHLSIAKKTDTQKFVNELKAHQGGATDFPTFCRMAAQCGVDRWTVSTQDLTCSYLDVAGNAMLIEEIPQ